MEMLRVEGRRIVDALGRPVQLRGAAIGINPFDVSATAAALAAALSMTSEERVRHAAAVRAAASVRTPRDWLDDQLAAARP